VFCQPVLGEKIHCSICMARIHIGNQHHLYQEAVKVPRELLHLEPCLWPHEGIRKIFTVGASGRHFEHLFHKCREFPIGHHPFDLKEQGRYFRLREIPTLFCSQMVQAHQTQAIGKISIWWAEAEGVLSGELLAPGGIGNGDRIPMFNHPAQKVVMLTVPKEERELSLNRDLIGAGQADEQIVARLVS
jgi:hypothetical protein